MKRLKVSWVSNNSSLVNTCFFYIYSLGRSSWWDNSPVIQLIISWKQCRQSRHVCSTKIPHNPIIWLLCCYFCKILMAGECPLSPAHTESNRDRPLWKASLKARVTADVTCSFFSPYFSTSVHYINYSSVKEFFLVYSCDAQLNLQHFLQMDVVACW